MWGQEALTGLDPVLGTMAVPVWAAGAVAALLVVLCIAAFARAGGVLGTTLRVGLVFVGVAAVGLLLVERQTTADRRAVETRIAELTARAVAPGSPLACLDGWGGETVEAACEKLVFASPESLSAAVSYVAARLALLSQAVALAPRQGSDSPTLEGLRLAAESDRFGLVSHVLVTRDGCTPEACVQLSMLRDAGRVSENLKERTFDIVLARHAAEWGVAPAVAAAPRGAAPATAAAGAPTVPTVASSTSANAPFFPSSASIPPISIMNAEPSAPVAPPAPAQAAAEPRRPTTPLPPRRPQSQPPQQQQPQGQGPMQLAPATTGAEPRAQ